MPKTKPTASSSLLGDGLVLLTIFLFSLVAMVVIVPVSLVLSCIGFVGSGSAPAPCQLPHRDEPHW